MYDFNNIYQPKTVREALEMKKAHPDALFLAGGSDILIQCREGKLAGRDVISIFNLDELRGVCLEEDGTILIRPMTSFSHITNHPIIQKYIPTLAYAVDQIGGPQIRNVGTIGGNICNGVTSADSATTLKTYDAILEIASVDGIRVAPYSTFSLGAGRVDLREGEMLTGIRVKKDSYENTFGNYIKYSMRRAMDIATLGCSLNVRLSDDKKKIDRVRISYGVAGPVPLRATKAEATLQGAEINSDLLEKAALEVMNDVNPRNSWRASKDFRIQLIKELTRRTLKSSVEQAGGKF